MNNILDLKTPAQPQASARESEYGLANQGLTNLGQVYWNLPAEALYEEIIFRNEAKIARLGPLVANTGKHTTCSANDKFVVREPGSERDIWWGQYNRPFAPENFNVLYSRMQAFLQGRSLFVQDCFIGADPDYRMPVRVLTEFAWHSLFARNMFILPGPNEAYRSRVPQFTVIVAPSFKGIPQIDSTATETFVVLNFDQRLCLIGNTAYAGEIKKAVFTFMNYLMPLEGVLPMHCSANVGPNGDVAIFFGSPGAGKTTLSADSQRGLIGDDENGWSDNGVFNFEGGGYAKVNQLSPTAEPQIYATTRRFGTILENVSYDPVTRLINLDDDALTGNTRASYPLEYIEHALPAHRSGHPQNIMLLTCDASGVMPPIAKLTPAQAVYQFLSGYTSELEGTKAGVGREPAITFSPCFGGPFMVHHPCRYAELLKRKIEHHDVNCWLVNTGWIGGPYGEGQRISIQQTRALLNAALSGRLLGAAYHTDPVFGFQVPDACEGVPASVLDPAGSWRNRGVYVSRYRQLASRFIDNFAKFESSTPPEVVQAGPHL